MFKLTILSLIVAVVCSCSLSENHDKKKLVKGTAPPDKKSEFFSGAYALNKILESKVLHAVTDFGPSSYFIYHGEPMGYQYEFLKKFSEYLGVELELKTEKNLLNSMQMLENGQVDIIAMGLTVTNERKNKFDFTDPILFTRQVLVQRKPKGWEKMKTLDEIESHLIRNTLDLAGKTIYVKKGTVYKNRLTAMANSIADSIIIIEDERWTDKLIDAVSSGEIDYTIADEHIALVNAREHKNIDIKTPVSFPQKVSWAVQKGQTALVDTLNFWLRSFKKKIEYRLLYNKYFINRRASRIAKSNYNSYSGNQLSPYDDLIKKHSQIIGWDWRLIASLIYQESDFKPNARSWVGAYGLMQLMPTVLEKYGLDTTATPEQQIVAGIKHLKYIEGLVSKVVDDSTQWQNFVLASYNSGIGHILDARRLAKKYNKNPDVWNGNVDEFVLKLSDKEYYHDSLVQYGYMRGQETYNFVAEITYRYEQYRDLIKD
ncbi:MAG: transporter substrate-binding domain-containing protein [Chlorobi bacterium]|nr:transporter substrate-binding domain-containing protein [Chlorobiota bacterium]